jgi:hypothetical protein
MFAFSLPGYALKNRGQGVGTDGQFSAANDAQHDEQLLPVRSCFGGLAIYSLPRIRATGCGYDERGLECEHVSLNSCLDDAFPNSVFIDTMARVYYDSVSFAADHST